eukprot:Amastigsp_a174468_31.p1 type:complete len:483 gc:universal Amastigsp_a174468_31:43-1491(+)
MSTPSPAAPSAAKDGGNAAQASNARRTATSLPPKRKPRHVSESIMCLAVMFVPFALALFAYGVIVLFHSEGASHKQNVPRRAMELFAVCAFSVAALGCALLFTALSMVGRTKRPVGLCSFCDRKVLHGDPTIEQDPPGGLLVIPEMLSFILLCVAEAFGLAMYVRMGVANRSIMVEKYYQLMLFLYLFCWTYLVFIAVYAVYLLTALYNIFTWRPLDPRTVARQPASADDDADLEAETGRTEDRRTTQERAHSAAAASSSQAPREKPSAASTSATRESSNVTTVAAAAVKSAPAAAKGSQASLAAKASPRAAAVYASDSYSYSNDKGAERSRRRGSNGGGGGGTHTIERVVERTHVEHHTVIVNNVGTSTAHSASETAGSAGAAAPLTGASLAASSGLDGARVRRSHKVRRRTTKSTKEMPPDAEDEPLELSESEKLRRKRLVKRRIPSRKSKSIDAIADDDASAHSYSYYEYSFELSSDVN